MPPGFANRKDTLGNSDLDDLESGSKEQGGKRFLQGDHQDVNVLTQVAQPVQILAECRADGPL